MTLENCLVTVFKVFHQETKTGHPDTFPHSLAAVKGEKNPEVINVTV